jgi:cell division protein FtsN
MLFGLSIGLVAAAAVYFSGHRAPTAPTMSAAPPRIEPAIDRPTTRQPASGPTDDEAVSEPHPASRFDFYDMLPLVEVVIPNEPRGEQRNAPAADVESAGNYVLQAGAFTGLEDADRMQANLALLGIESRIQSVPIDDDIYHRVRIGPIDDLSELNRIRRRLWEADVDTMLLRVPN